MYFQLSGCALIAVGIWIIVDPSIVKILDFVIEVSQDSLIKYAAYVLIAIGGFVFIVGFLGCCGAIKESKCMLGIVSIYTSMLPWQRYHKTHFTSTGIY